MALAAMVGSLLRSDINLIGLSVMDVLLGLIKQMRKLFQLQLSDTPDDSADEKAGHDEIAAAAMATTAPTAATTATATTTTTSGLPKRRELLAQLEQCVGDLATHVYYADQVPDMISAILVRLKPSSTSSTTSTPCCSPRCSCVPAATW